MKKNLNQKTYFDLTEHNKMQVIVFAIITISLFVSALLFSLPMQRNFFEKFLLGEVHVTGDPLPYSFQTQDNFHQPSYLFAWAIDFDAKSSNPTRHWYNPTMSVSLVIGLLAVALTAIITSLLPQKFGFMRQKIERETLNLLDKISLHKYGYYGKEEQQEVANDLIKADLRDLHEMANESIMTLEDLKVIKKALEWIQAPFYKKLIKVNDGLKLYMRFYFTIQYGNMMLGLVYIGASFLIISIGLRGIKFIPPTQPSYILFALGLEFSLLLVFAITTIYQRQEDEHESDSGARAGGGSAFGTKHQNIGNDYGTAKEIEQLLRVFIKSKKM